MKWIAGAIKCLVCFLIFAEYGFAQQTASDVSSRTILVNVLDLQGNSITGGLQKENFRLRANGRPAELLNGQYSEAPRRIVVLLDMSGSMGTLKDNKWRFACEAVSDLLQLIPAQTQIALLTFSAKVHDTFTFSQGKSAIQEWLKRDHTWTGKGKRELHGTTALLDAISQAVQLLQPYEAGDAIYAITDGGDNSSNSVRGDRLAFLESGVRLFAFLFDQTGSTVMPPENPIPQLVSDSGGFAYLIAGYSAVGLERWDLMYDYDEAHRNRLRLYTQNLINQVNGFWTLQVLVPSSNKKVKFTLEIVDQYGKPRKDVAYTYTRFLKTPN